MNLGNQLKAKCDNNKQYSRRTILWNHGIEVPEKKKKWWRHNYNIKDLIWKDKDDFWLRVYRLSTSSREWVYRREYREKGAVNNCEIEVVEHCVQSVCIRSFSGLYFLAFGLNTERYGVQIWTRIFWTRTLSMQWKSSKTFSMA